MKIFAILAVTGLVASPVLAGSLDQPIVEPVIVAEPAPQPVATGGDWTGFYAGAQLGYGDLGSSSGTLDGNGAVGGVHAGYNYDFGQFVLGGEIDYDMANIDLGAGAGSLDSVARLKLKAGADLGRTLIYGTAGAAQASADVGGTTLRDTGYFGGVGLDYALTDQWSLGGEVLVHRFDNFDSSGIDLDATTATARASFHF